MRERLWLLLLRLLVGKRAVMMNTRFDLPAPDDTIRPSGHRLLVYRCQFIGPGRFPEHWEHYPLVLEEWK